MAANESTQQGSVIAEAGVSSCYGYAWNQLWKYPLELFLIFIIYAVITAPGSSMNASTSFIWTIYNILVVGPVSFGTSYVYLKVVRGDPFKIKDMFDGSKNYWNVVLASLVVSVIVIIGFILLIVPGIIFACKLAFVPFLVMDRKMEAVAAVRESWRMSDGYAPDVFYIGLLGIPILIAGAICFGVGIIVSCMWISLAIASLYHTVSLKQQESQQSPMQ